MKLSNLTGAFRSVLPVKYCGVVIVAAGNASRMEGIDKVMADLGGKPLVLRSVRTFQNCDTVREIVIVTRADLVDKITALCAPYDKVKKVVVGGADRPESVQKGLEALSPKVRLAAVHDGARPLVTGAVIDRTVRAAQTYGAAAPGVQVKDTVKIVKSGLVKETPERKTLQAIQTPQIFDCALLKAALKKAKEENAAITDDCSAVERMGMSVKIVEGDERNIKVTTPMDLKIAAMLLEEMQ